LYALLAWCCEAGVRLGMSLALPLGGAAALAVGALLVWQLREQAEVPGSREVFAVAVAAAGALVFALGLPSRGASARRAAAHLGAAAALGAGVVLAGWHGSNAFRWHLLRHNTAIGTPVWWALGQPVDELRSRLWEEAAQVSPAEAAAAAPAPPAASGAPAPNLVFVLIDTLRADVLRAWGGAGDLAPNLESLAERSIVFTDVIANATWTRPSVASMFTGVQPEVHGAVDRPYGLPQAFRTLAEVLRERGFDTAAFVSNYGAVGRDAGFAQGFAHFDELDGGEYSYARAERVNDAVLAWLERRGADAAPVFLYVHYLDPHTPYLSGGRPSHRTALARESYDLEVRYLDGELPRLLRGVGSALPGPTVWFITSDHGEEFGEHGEVGHGQSLYREVLALPALLALPDGRSGRSGEKLEARDFFDLLLRLLAEPDLDVTAWAAARARETRYASIYSTTSKFPWHRAYKRNVAMRGFEREGRYLIWSAYGDTVELYDLEQDPQQERNLAQDHPELARELRRSLDTQIERFTLREDIEQDDESLELLRRLGYIQ
jgi:arylsulfatase A-like enzyme